MIDGFPLSFFLPLVVHALAGLTTGVTGVVAFRAPKSRGRHHRRGRYYLWAYTAVFFTATILTVQRWAADAYLFFLALTGYGFALAGYGARRFRREPSFVRLLGKQWVVAHIVGMIGSYVVLWTAFYVDNAHLIPAARVLGASHRDWDPVHYRVHLALCSEQERAIFPVPCEKEHGTQGGGRWPPIS